MRRDWEKEAGGVSFQACNKDIHPKNETKR